MLGIVFTTLVDMLEEKISPEFADEVLVEADLENEGAFTAVGYYPFSEMEKILTVLVNKTGQSADELLYGFGEYLFGVLAKAHGEVMTGKVTILDVLESLDNDIHVQVRKLYPDADLPSFKVLSRTQNSIELEYHSLRDLFKLAEGLIDGAAKHLGNVVTHHVQNTNEPHTYIIRVDME